MSTLIVETESEMELAREARHPGRDPGLFDRVLSYFDCVWLVPAACPPSILWVIGRGKYYVGGEDPACIYASPSTSEGDISTLHSDILLRIPKRLSWI